MYDCSCYIVNFLVSRSDLSGVCLFFTISNFIRLQNHIFVNFSISSHSYLVIQESIKEVEKRDLHVKKITKNESYITNKNEEMKRDN